MAMASQPETVFPLLQLPAPCLLAVLQACAADDPCTLFSAARAHSRLHQAAAVALRSIKAELRQQQHKADSLLLYLGRHGCHISSIDVDAQPPVALGHFPGAASSLAHLTSLRVCGVCLCLQLQPYRDLQGVLNPELPLKQLCLEDFSLTGREPDLAAALSLLPGLEHLSICVDPESYARPLAFPGEALQALPLLTCLELRRFDWRASVDTLQRLQHLTALQQLRLHLQERAVQASRLSGLSCLTLLEVSGFRMFDPAGLAGCTQLQHLKLHVEPAGPTPGQALGGLLSQLQQLQQLTHLDLQLPFDFSAAPPAALFAALTASSKLQHLRVWDCAFAAGFWRHLLPPGRKLPHLRALSLGGLFYPAAPIETAPGSCLVSCCPGLTTLELEALPASAELLAALQGLSSLRELSLLTGVLRQSSIVQEMELVCHLTGLRKLILYHTGSLEVQLPPEGVCPHLQLARLQQLTRLEYIGGGYEFNFQDPSGLGVPPVWRQVLLHLASSSDPEVAQQAAAALASCRGQL